MTTLAFRPRRLRAVVDETRLSLRYRGLIATARRSLARVVASRSLPGEALEFDRRYGVDTSGSVPLSEVETIGDNADAGVDYSGTHGPAFLQAIDSLEIDYRRFVFIDYGSGKGKALLLASWYPFRRIAGVEFSPELHAIADRNIDAFRSSKQRCHDIVSICADATTFEAPGGHCVHYFFNPFGERVMRQVLANILAAHNEKRGEAYVVYFNPLLASMVEDAGFRQIGRAGAHNVYRL
ncbi:MAG TPA: class I SAM-dependent methyltransferase [Dehalococcoidia bacterium]|nr:class I SAM-dependent methyltransferase [Dehalococcoidia bacterium]